MQSPDVTPTPRELQCRFAEKEEPKLRHEFVALMFAIAAGEVGLQVAGLIAQSEDWHCLLPAYSHLALAMIVIAASWVGWTVSPSPGGRKDVTKVLESEFVVLLIDVACVVCYFILARQVDFRPSENGHPAEYHPSAKPESHWIFIIFCLYLFWDAWTKVVVHFVGRRFKSTKDDVKWYPYYFVRFFPTLICLGLAYWAWTRFNGQLSAAQVVIADGALLMLVLLFRALKDLASALWPTKGIRTRGRTTWSIGVSAFFLIGFVILTVWARCGPNGWLTRYIGTPHGFAVEQRD
jgi:hypothetical protein